MGKDIFQEDDRIIEKFRKASIGKLSEEERKKLWDRIDRTTGKSIFFSRIYPWLAAASIILLLGIGYVWHNSGSEVHPEMQVMVVVRTESQQKKHIVLPDSSVVWLNANSKLEYPERFVSNCRKVILTGEAHFDVSKDVSRPFIVQASEMDVKVLGTTFNITAYDNENEIIATLLDGKVEIHLSEMYQQAITIMPNQQAIYHKDNNKLTLAIVNPEFYTSWMDGFYKFESTSFVQIAKQYSRLYGVTFVFEDNALEKLSYTGTFLQEQGIESVLNLLQSINEFKHKIIGDSIYISQK